MSERAINPDNGWQINADGRYEWAEGGSSGAGMVISETEPTDKVEGMQWLNPTTGLVLFWDGEKWLEMPAGGGGGGADYDDSWIQPELDGKANVGDSYTKAESDSTFIDDAPADGNLYIRKDGAWEEFVPSSSSGGGNGYMEIIVQPSTWGMLDDGADAAGVYQKQGGFNFWNDLSGRVSLNTPPGMHFLLSNVVVESTTFKGKDLVLDGVALFPSSTADTTKLFDQDVLVYAPIIVKDSLQLDVTINVCTVRIYGFFVPDGTRSGALKREVYGAVSKVKGAIDSLKSPATQESDDE